MWVRSSSTISSQRRRGIAASTSPYRSPCGSRTARPRPAAIPGEAFGGHREPKGAGSLDRVHEVADAFEVHGREALAPGYELGPPHVVPRDGHLLRVRG